jgi:CheY-like chemotaxis protein
MAAYSLQAAQMVMAESDVLFVRNAGEAFRARGLRELIVCRDADQLRNFMHPMVDVLLCDIDLPGLDFCPMVQQVRQNQTGLNPFAVMLGTGRASSGADMRQVVKSGIDDFMLKSLPTDQLVRRVHSFAEKRKPFVVTRDYVGPNRRPQPRKDGSDDALIEVPNTLRSRLVDGTRQSQLREIIQKALSDIAVKKTETEHKSVVRLVKQFNRQVMNADRANEIRRTLEILALKCEAVGEAAEAIDAGSVAEIAKRIARLARRVLEAAERPSQQVVSLMVRLGEAVQASFAAVAGADAIAREIATTVDRFLEQK